MKRERKMRVEKLSKDHLQTRYEWLNHPRIFQHMNMQYPISLLETEAWYNRIYNNPNRIDLVFFEDNSIVAMTGLTSISAVDGLAEFYIMVSPNYQSKGIGSKSTIYTINYAFYNFNIHKIYLYTNNFNEKANGLYEKLGFSLEGVLKKHKFKNGHHIDRCIYGLLKDDWKKSEYFCKDVLLEF